MAGQPYWALAFFLLRFTNHTRLHTMHSVELLWMSDWPVAEIPLRDNTQHSHETDINAPGWVRIRFLLRTWLFVFCVAVCCLGSGVCELITHTEESCRVVCVCVCHLETITVRRPRPIWAVTPPKKRILLSYP